MLKTVRKIFFVLFLSQLVYIIALKWIDPPFTLTQLGSLFSGDGLKRDYVSFSEMSSEAGLAVMAAEDQLLPDHHGFDFKNIERALSHNEKKPKKIRGASTISQQVAKNVFLWQDRSWLRKGLEVYFTFMIELIWGKQRILEMYLNVIEMGKGIFGIEAAAKEYFNKPASKLNRTQAAMIAASLPNPKKYTVKPVSRYVSIRSKWVIRQMGFLEGDDGIKGLLGKR
ncbi:MAG: monofunctional biosynthetic peptidoglycan transglycosylase [Chitinophagaceae bacterium]|nr:monofunctional biosynthetic peptidoglycan transglycosylase [Chitinophagaceae bacterium]